MAADKTELRGLVPTPLAQALDALALADGLDRNEYVTRVLHGHVVVEVHKLNVRTRTLKGNPYLTESNADFMECGTAQKEPK